MTVEVHFKFRQALFDTVLGTSLAGDGLLVRLRSTSIAMLAAVAAIGLGLVAFASQIGWPSVFSGPIPTSPQLGVVRNDPIVAPQGARHVRAERTSRAARKGSAQGHAVSTAGGGDGPDAGVAPSHETGLPAAKPPAPGTPAPTHAAPPPAGTTAPEAVLVTKPASPEAPPAEAPGPSPPAGSQGDSPGKPGEGHGHAPEVPPGHSPQGGPPSWAANDDHGKPDWAGH